MRTPAQRPDAPHAATRWLGGLLAALVLCLAAFAVSPAAHNEIHHDSGHAQHQCAITLYAQGAESAHIAVEVSCPLGLAEVGSICAREFAGVAEPAHLRPPASGPPLA